MILTYIRTTQNIPFIKNIHTVDMRVINNASFECVIRNCSATLNLLDGLSLAIKIRKQFLIQDMENIAGQDKKTINCTIIDDKKANIT